MRAVNFDSNRRRRPQPIVWNNFQGVNEVDDNVNLPAQQVPYAQNVDFGRIVGSAAKRFGMEALFRGVNLLTTNCSSVETDTAGFGNWGAATITRDTSEYWTGSASLKVVTPNAHNYEGTVVSSYPVPTVGLAYSGQVMIKGTIGKVINIFFRTLNSGKSAGIDTKSTNVTLNGTWQRVTLENLVATTGASFLDMVITTGDTIQAVTFYIDGLQIEQGSTATAWEIGGNYLGAGGVKGQHCYRSTAGDIPLIAHGTDVYKLSGASTSRTTDTEVKFNAGTKTDVVVLPDVVAPVTAPTLDVYSAGSGLTGDYYGKVTFVTVTGAESNTGPASIKMTYSSQIPEWSNVPTGGAGVAQRKLYRTKAGGTTYYLVATIDNNIATTYTDNVADSSLVIEYADKRVILGPGSTKGVAIITQSITGYSFSLNSPSVLFGQTFTIPTGIRKIYSISPYLSELTTGERITLTLYTDTGKTTMVGSATLMGAQPDGEMDFILNAIVTPGAGYYWEITVPAGTGVTGYYTKTDPYPGGQMYQNGTAMTGYDIQFTVYGCKYALEGTYESELIDLTTAPTIATLSFSETLNGQTVAWFAKGSSDNATWGDWQAVMATGDGIPLARYIKIKAVLGSVDGSATPSVKDYTITYNSGYGTVTSIQGSMSGDSVRFVDWDDRVWFTDGVKNYVYDGTTVTEVGLTPAATCSKPPASTIIHIHKNYAFYVEAAVPSRVYVSKVNDPNSIPAASYFQFPGAVLGIKTHGDYLVVSGKQFGQHTAGGIFDVDPAVGDWDWKELDHIGCISHEAMVECFDAAANQMLVMPTDLGLKYLSPNLLGSNLQSTPLSRNVQHYFDEAITRETMSAIFHNQAYYIAFNWADPAATPGVNNNVVFKLDLRNREWSGPWFMNVSGFFIIGSNLYMASSTIGRVYKHSGTSDDGVAIDMILDSSYKGSWEKRNFTKLIAMVKRGSVTDDTTILTRVDNLERTIALGSCASWAGSGGSARDVQDEVTSPQKAISGGRGFNMGWRFEDDSVNDVVLYGITVLAEPPT
jgi:hypothetical protein